ncbi:MAG: NADH-quinone oxidoreductase subunit NuoE [Actinobacteria bacterium]|nr:NADH-quinone oxidoreductase subunit NuoE [Actinomycetota bacterium]
MAKKATPEMKAVEKYEGKRSCLIQILHEIQKEYRYLPEPALRYVSEAIDVPLTDIYGVATFFKAFSLEPKGKHTVTCCMGTACHVRNSAGVLDELKRTLGIEPGETTEDMLFSLETVNCLGACALGPVVVIDDKYYGEVTPVKVKKIIAEVKKGEGKK